MAASLCFHVGFILLCLACSDAYAEWLQNADFESTSYDGNWYGFGCNIAPSNDSYQGQHSVHVSNRLTGTGVNASTVELEVIQLKHEFIFGSVVDARKIVDNNLQAYQKVFYDNFEWAVLENAFKWKIIKWNRGTVDYNTALTAVNALRSHGIKVRGHCAFWSVDSEVQDWVQALIGGDLYAAIHERIQGVIGHTKVLLEMWDVTNENQHGDFYERQTGNPDITMEMFRQVHAVDDRPRLFLNDFNVISADEVTVPNAVGLVYQDLVKNQWKTRTNIHGNQAVHASAFKDEHMLSVRHNGNILKTETITVTDGGKDLTVHLGDQQAGSPTVSHIVVG